MQHLSGLVLVVLISALSVVATFTGVGNYTIKSNSTGYDLRLGFFQSKSGPYSARTAPFGTIGQWTVEKSGATAFFKIKNIYEKLYTSSDSKENAPVHADKQGTSVSIESANGGLYKIKTAGNDPLYWSIGSPIGYGGDATITLKYESDASDQLFAFEALNSTTDH